MLMMNKIYNILIKTVLPVLLSLVSIAAAAQSNVTVTGTITDETGQPLIGAGVIQSGTTTGAVADLDGKYSIIVPKTAVLNFNYIGYKSVEIPVSGKTVIDVQLFPDNNVLDEVVVIGYGTVKRSDLTGSVSSVNSKAIEDYKTGSVIEALGGQVAGVSITASDGTPGSGFDVKIRGVGSVNGDTAPLYIVDGYEVDNIDYLANQDIQSIDFLKDASSSAIYGARAANGVVLVTTKSGKEGKPSVTYNGSASYRILSKKLKTLSMYDFVSLQEELKPSNANTYYQAGNDDNGVPYRFQSKDDYLNYSGIDWQDEAFSPTWSQNHEVSVRGGSKDSQYNVSFTHFDENGIFKGTGASKNAARVKFNQKITNWLKMDLSVNYTRTKKQNGGSGGSTLVNLLRYRPTGGNRTSDEVLRYATYDPEALADGTVNSNDNNPILQAESVINDIISDQWIASGSLTATIIKGLTFKTSGTYNNNYQRRNTFYLDESSQAVRGGGAYGSSQMSKALKWSNSNTLTYDKTFAKKHKTNFILGHEVTFDGTELLYGQSKDLPFSDFTNDNLGLGATPSAVNTSRSEKMRLSFFFRGFYSYADKYMLTATFRADASTVFSNKNKWGFFPSFAAAWTLSKEDWLKDVSWLSLLKIRVGWGQVGNDRISNFLSMDLYSNSRYGVGTTQYTVLTPKQIANQDLKWEGSTTTNVGIDFNVMDSRLNLSIDGFIKDTRDLLLAQDLAHVTGFDVQWRNIGKIRNKGIEITINSVNFNKRNFFWSTDFNISFLKNTLVSLQDGAQYKQDATGFNSNFSSYDYISYVGSSIGDMYGYQFDGIYQYSDFDAVPGGGLQLKPGVVNMDQHYATSVQPGFVKYKDIDGDGVITTNDRTVIGNGQPDWYGGITNTFQFYGVDLSFMFQFNYGNDVYNATRLFSTQSSAERYNQLAEVSDRWTPTNASNAVPSAKGYVQSELYSRFIEDGSFLRLKNLTLGYTLPEKITRKFYVQKLRIYATASNLFCVTKYSGYDPEVNMKTSPLMPSFDWSSYPKNKTFTFGLELQF